MRSSWLKAIVISVCALAVTTASAATRSYDYFTNAQGGIFLKAPKQFVLLHGDISIPLYVMPLTHANRRKLP